MIDYSQGNTVSLQFMSRVLFELAKITYYLPSLPPVKNTIEVRDAIC